MSRLYDTVEPSVIDEEMLMRAVEEQGPKEEAGKLAKIEGIDFGDVRHLRLDFKNILKIDGLWEFVNLTKLQLDNNIIEKIEGIDMLVNIVWLDLSFNNIEVIEGLDALTKLEDLTLYNNRISRIENMDTLMALQVFSIGNNDLKELETISYLRRFRKLKTLNLSNNPFCELDNYKQYVAAFLPDLEFLDYRLLDDQTKAAAYERHQTQVEEMMDNEKKAQTKEEENERKAKEYEVHKKAYVELLNGPELFDSMYSEDPEGLKLKQMPGVDEILVVFGEKFSAICQQIFEYGLQEHTRREGEVNQFWESVEEAKTENKDMGMKAVDEFLLEKKRLFAELTHVSDPKLLEQKVNEYNAHVTELWDTLMGLEVQLVDQLEEVLQNFDRNMQDLVSTFIEYLQGFLAQARDVENLHNEKMMEIAQITLDKVAKNEFDEEISEELRMLFVDKDTIMNAVSTSHDAHLMKIDNKEDDIVTRINNWLKNMIETIHEEQEIKRNRSRVTEINHLIDHLREEIDNLEMVTGPNY
ncbi:dynein regulatory complex subunit 3-like [Littorina saxatilis]|uniref:dynein regulatory complex subunit 3-like n=1 Tax=Littorina saxatilis TaxID=31220 RepID=UPI0038B61097